MLGAQVVNLLGKLLQNLLVASLVLLAAEVILVLVVQKLAEVVQKLAVVQMRQLFDGLIVEDDTDSVERSDVLISKGKRLYANPVTKIQTDELANVPIITDRKARKFSSCIGLEFTDNNENISYMITNIVSEQKGAENKSFSFVLRCTDEDESQTPILLPCDKFIKDALSTKNIYTFTDSDAALMVLRDTKVVKEKKDKSRDEIPKMKSVVSMSIEELKAELDSYGIHDSETKTKKHLVEKLKTCRVQTIAPSLSLEQASDISETASKKIKRFDNQSLEQPKSGNMKKIKTI